MIEPAVITPAPPTSIARPTGLIVTTCRSAGGETVSRARELADELGGLYVAREWFSIEHLIAEYGAAAALIVQHSRLLARLADGGEYAYHPNMILVRGHNVLAGRRDVFIDAIDVAPGDRVLDCTLGFGCEAILASMAVGPEGAVTGLESMPLLAAITRDGMGRFKLGQADIIAAMRHVDVVCADYRSYLAEAVPKSVAVAYFDPFFEHRTEGSEESVSPLYAFGDHGPLDAVAVLRAREIATKRVVIKHPRSMLLPESVEAYVVKRLTGRKSSTGYSILSASPDS